MLFVDPIQVRALLKVSLTDSIAGLPDNVIQQPVYTERAIAYVTSRVASVDETNPHIQSAVNMACAAYIAQAGIIVDITSSKDSSGGGFTAEPTDYEAKALKLFADADAEIGLALGKSSLTTSSSSMRVGRRTLTPEERRSFVN